MPIYVAGTGDTNGRKLVYVKEMLLADGVPALLVDLTASDAAENVLDRGAGISPAQVAQSHPDDTGAVFTGDRGSAVLGMAEAFEKFILSRDDVSGLIGLGGSCGTAIVTPARRALPIRAPKLTASTVASGNVAAFVGPSDIAMMYSVTGIAGLNLISRVVVANAAHAVAGMARAARNTNSDAGKPSLGIPMFGVPTPAVTELARILGESWNCLVFHATGTGGRATEKRIDSASWQG